MLDTLSSLYAPHHCLGCQTEGALLCSSCLTSLSRAPDRCYRCHALSFGGRTCTGCRRHSKLYGVQTVTVYEGFGKELIARLKFSGTRAAAKTIAALMSTLALPADAIIVPIPTATSRVRLRGYDQAMLIGKICAHMAERPFAPILRRIGQHRQVGASRAERVAHMDGSFVVWHPERIRGRTVVLIDDVLTTGATLESAAAVVKAAGAKRVQAVVFARA